VTFRTLIRRSLRFHWRAHLGVALGAAVGAAALIGALIVGDSVRGTLRERALARLGPIHFAVTTQDRLFLSGLDLRLYANSNRSPAPAGKASSRTLIPSYPCSALALPGVTVKQDGTARANRVNIIGVEMNPWSHMAGWRGNPGWQPSWQARTGVPALTVGGIFSLSEDGLSRWTQGETALVNQTLARQLRARKGDDIVVRVLKPSALGSDAALSPRDENTVAIRLKVGAILPPELLGDLSLAAQQTPPANLFLPLESLAEKLGVPARANLLVKGFVFTEREIIGWDRQRQKWAKWLMRRVSSWRMRAARWLDPDVGGEPVPDEEALPWLNAQLALAWAPEDAELVVRAVEQPQTATGGEYVQPFIELSSRRIFLEPAVVAAALQPRTNLLSGHGQIRTDTTDDLAASAWVTNGVGVLTYLVNLIQAGDRATPYSMVTAAGKPYTPPDLRDDEIIVNEWLAEDLQVKPGDTVRLSYYAVDSGARLAERTNAFRVRGVVPMRGVYADRTLMPEFPGVAKAERTRDWDTGFPLVHTIRDKDEAYWEHHRGTPKAFISLAAGQTIWANRFGQLTAIRYPVPADSFASAWPEVVRRTLMANLDPASVGLTFEPVRLRALKAAEQSQDFGQLFLGFSFFLIAAALLLMALLFQFGLEQRTAEVGTLLALGFRPKQVRRLLLGEGVALAFLGGVIGAVAGVGYARTMLRGLTTIWREAVAESALSFHITPLTLLIGLFASVVVSGLTIALVLRRQASRPARELLAEGGEERGAWSVERGAWGGKSVLVAAGAGAGALALIAWAVLSGETANAGAFFGAGALVLVGGLSVVGAWLRRLAGGGHIPGTPILSPGETEKGKRGKGEEETQSKRPSPLPLFSSAPLPQEGRLTLGALGLRSCARRRKRSLATVAMLACGSFLIVAIGVFRLDANRDATSRASGTGGFALIGESALPVAHDLNSKPGRDFFALSESDLAGASIVPFRVREGDEASCLNLNRAQRPRLLGVKPELLKGRFTFAKVAKGADAKAGWEILRGHPRAAAGQSQIANRKSQMEEVSAVGDQNSILWALGKKVGDTLDFTDERGRAFKVRLVGAVANSILQGSLIIDEEELAKRFPSESGHRMFLIDAPANSVSQVSATLARAMQDVGLELTPAARRLAQFNAVQNTYLGTFQVLGGLGLLLGSVGLGIVVLRNVLERRGELALLLAVGFLSRAVQRLLLVEHGALLGLGLALGTVAAAVAVLPSLLAPGAQLPFGSLALTLGAVLLNGALWTWGATRLALRGELLEALRNE
jgi:ABC-type antimicrobial peptide transport system permease subunit